MTTDEIREKLAINMRRIRLRYGTQDRFKEQVKISQTYTSDLENRKGWKSLFNVLTALEKAGTDPAELLDLGRVPTPAPELPAEEVELLTLWRAVEDTGVRRGAILMLRAAVAMAAGPSVIR